MNLLRLFTIASLILALFNSTTPQVSAASPHSLQSSSGSAGSPSGSSSSSSSDDCGGVEVSGSSAAQSPTASSGDDDSSGGLCITKTAESAQVTQGQVARFILQVENKEQMASSNAILTDPLPALPGLSWSIDAPVPSGCAISSSVSGGSTLTCDFGSLESGGKRVVTVSSPTTAFCGTISNTASLSGGDEDKDGDEGASSSSLIGKTSDDGDEDDAGSSNSATAAIQVTCAPLPPALSLVKTADASQVTAGSPVGFTLTVSNNGQGPANQVHLVDQLDPALSWTETTGAPCTISATWLLACDFPFLAVNASVSVHISAPTSAGMNLSVSNTAHVSAVNNPLETSNTETVTIQNLPQPHLKLTKTAENPRLAQGGRARFLLVVSNDGAGAATGVVLTDPLFSAAGLSWVIDAPAPSGCTIAATTLTCDFGSLDPGASKSVSVSSATDLFTGEISNTATVSATNGAGGTGTAATSTAVTDVTAPACQNTGTINGQYFNDFQGTSPGAAGIQDYKTSTAPKGQKFLGEYGNETVTLTADCLNTMHDRVLISFDLYIIRSWDGNSTGVGPDHLQVWIDGGPVLLDTTFSNWSISKQSYPGNYPATNPALDGATGAETLGYVYVGNIPMDATYHLNFVIPHTGPLLTLKVAGSNLEPIDNESWGLDNLVIAPLGLNHLYAPIIMR